MPDSFLPTSMQNRRAELEQQELERQNGTVLNTDVDNSTTVVENLQNGDEVTLTRAELNKLQAAADLSDKHRREAEQAALDLEEARERLTRAPEPSKGNHQDGARPDATGPQPVEYELQTGVELTEKEKEDYDQDAINVIIKVVRAELNKIFPNLTKAINENLEKVTNLAKSTGQDIEKNIQRQTDLQFKNKLNTHVPDIQELVNHQDWPAFLESKQKGSGLRYKDLFVFNYREQDLETLADICTQFREKYIGTKTNTKDGYATVPASGNAPLPVDGKEKEMLKMSDRRKAQKDFINRTNGMTAEKLDIIKAAFNKAEQENRITYD